MIYTITTNPSIDYYLLMKQPTVKETVNRVDSVRYELGGKGVNVSRVLNNLNMKSEAVLFTGGFSGVFLKETFQQYPNINAVCIPIQDTSRINVKVRDGGECDYNSDGPQILLSEQKAMLQYLKKIEADDYVLLCGKLAKGLDDDFLIQIADLVKQKNAHLILDLPELSLSLLKKCHPFLIKPNLEELRTVFPQEQINQNNYQSYSKVLIDGYVDNILLSLGEEGAYFDGLLETYTVQGPHLKQVDTLGAGDAMLAAFVGHYAGNGNLVEALRWAAAAGCATVSSYGLPSKEQIEQYLPDVTIGHR